MELMIERDTELAIFGAGAYGKEVLAKLTQEGKKIICFIDNNESIQGTTVNGIEILSLDEFKKLHCDCEVIIACNVVFQIEIERQLKENNISNYRFYNGENNKRKQRVVSYCEQAELEDVILYHVLKNENEIFYIDVGSNDPVAGSVTKLLYDMKNAKGINIEPLEEMYQAACNERMRDINIRAGLGAKEGKMELCIQGGLSTLVKENVLSDKFSMEEVKITTLKKVCDKYLAPEQKISFLKIDVEGYEKEVLLGADFIHYRPYIIVMEATLPNTNIPSYHEWENILIENNYHFVYERGVNRYYIANEKKELESKFVDVDHMEDYYSIWHAKISLQS